VDPFDAYMIGRTLSDRWKVTARHEVIREAPSACRTYRAEGPNGEVVFVKVLVPDAGVALEEQRRQIFATNGTGLEVSLPRRSS
jgi:hypothetical protein